MKTQVVNAMASSRCENAAQAEESAAGRNESFVQKETTRTDL